MTDSRLRLRSLAALNVGGEPVVPADIERTLGRLESAVVIEQFGSTEMPGVALGCCTRGTDMGYELSTDRFAFRLEPRDNWQRLVVKDGFAPRAFPIDGSFATEDEVLLSAGKVLEVRRQGDASYALRTEIDALYRSGVVNPPGMDARGARVLRVVRISGVGSRAAGTRWPLLSGGLGATLSTGGFE